MADQDAMASLFDRAATTYDALGVGFFREFARDLLDLMGDLAGARVLDVGCGRGAVLFPAVDRVGERGTVVGIDLSSRMVELTAGETAERGLSNVTVAVMDAERPDLPDSSFDVVTAAFVAFFLPDPVAGLRSWHRLLAPGGRLGVTTFGPDDPRWAGVREVFKPFVSPSLGWTMAVRGELFATTQRFTAAVASAGFAEVRSVERSYPVRFAGPEEWIAWSWSHGQRMFWELVPEDGREDVRRAVLAALEPLREADGSLVMTQHVRYTIAER